MRESARDWSFARRSIFHHKVSNNKVSDNKIRVPCTWLVYFLWLNIPSLYSKNIFKINFFSRILSYGWFAVSRFALSKQFFLDRCAVVRLQTEEDPLRPITIIYLVSLSCMMFLHIIIFFSNNIFNSVQAIFSQ